MADYRSSFGQGGFNDQVDADALLDEIGLDRREIEDVAASTEEQAAKVQEIDRSIDRLSS